MKLSFNQKLLAVSKLFLPTSFTPSCTNIQKNNYITAEMLSLCILLVLVLLHPGSAPCIDGKFSFIVW